MNMKLPLVLILLIGFDLIMSTTSSGQKISGLSTVNSFRAAVVKKNISPSSPKQLLGYGARLSTGIHDSIYHRIIVLDDGSTQFFLISTEVCLMSPSEYDHVAGILQKKLGIQPVNFWWSVTHTHSAPEVGVPGLAEAFMGDRYKHPVDTAYTDFIEKSLIEGIQEARQKLEPARLGVGWGYSQANINRRAIDVDGRASLGLNPDGPVDRRIGLLRLEKADRSPLALIVNYPIHGTVLGQENVEISGDVTGMVANYVEHQTGVPVLFINGAAGNLAPIYSVYPNPRAGHLSQFRVLLGDKILEANNKLAVTSDSIKLFTGALTVEGPRKAQLGWPAYLDAYSHSGQNGNNTVKLPIRFLRINEEVAIWSAPLELFCEISNEIRDRSPFPYTFYYGYTNGWLGYLPTENEWKHGGYEVEVVSPFTPSMGKILTESVLGYLHGEMRR
ncbi:MAG: neutral/alkaline non-lysosomal ceramidase N-terminal domain-containing protein [Saprospiraceae bacterium]|jgi:hypothetical protein|nr:neutral/alkaline non-lysosomal ceramidase N-terminal domain-containing protein [Saprospiraceae bacterium]MBP7922096.1 neutral/alkaline non-lysosomal ceramidase N-terminal domain-containing protein [Saprospiraceae bacterium]